jgi:hypothetical protein
MTAERTWTLADEDEAVRGLTQLARDFPSVEVTIRWIGASGPGVTHMTAHWRGLVARAYTVDGLREGLLSA